MIRTILALICLALFTVDASACHGKHAARKAARQARRQGTTATYTETTTISVSGCAPAVVVPVPAVPNPPLTPPALKVKVKVG